MTPRHPFIMTLTPPWGKFLIFFLLGYRGNRAVAGFSVISLTGKVVLAMPHEGTVVTISQTLRHIYINY